MDSGKGGKDMAVPIDLVIVSNIELLPVAPTAPAVLPVGPAVYEEFGKNGDAETTERPPPVLSEPAILPLGTPVVSEKGG